MNECTLNAWIVLHVPFLGEDCLQLVCSEGFAWPQYAHMWLLCVRTSHLPLWQWLLGDPLCFPYFCVSLSILYVLGCILSAMIPTPGG